MRLPWKKKSEEPDGPESGSGTAEPAAPAPMDVAIRDEVIRLGQFLKLANLVETGAEAKPVIADGLVRVNGEVETRRGRQLRVGDVVELAGQAARVSDQDATDDLPW